MGVVGNIQIGMVVRSGGFSKGLKTAEGSLVAFTERAKGIGVGLKSAIAGGLAGAGIVGLYAKAASAASNLNEQVSATGVMFGDSAKIVTDDADKMAAKFGVVRSEYLASANSLAPLFTGIGKTDEESAKLSVGLLHLAQDLSSIRNVPVNDALMAIQSGLRGEAEPLRRFGVLLDDATMKAEGMRLGLVKGTADMSQAAKMQARLSLITSGLGYANGDLERTFDGVANQSRSFGGRITYFMEEAGKSLEPVTKALLNIGNEVLSGLTSMFMENKEAIADWAAGAVKSGGAINVAIEWVGKGIGAVADAFVVLPAVWKRAQSNLTAGWAGIADAIGWVGEQLANLINLIPGMHVTMGTTAKAVAADLHKLAAEQFAEYEKLTKTPLPSEKITAFFDKIREKIAAEKDKTADEATKAPRALAPELKKTGKDHTLAAAMDRGSKEAYSAIVQASVKMGGNDTQKQIAAINQQQLAVNAKALTAIQGIGQRLGQFLATTTGPTVAHL